MPFPSPMHESEVKSPMHESESEVKSPMRESESEVAKSCPTLSDPMDCSPPGSSAHGILQARALERNDLAVDKVLVSQSRPTVCDSKDCSPPGSSFHGILQARILEWVAIPFSRGSSPPRTEPGSPALQADALMHNEIFAITKNYA